MTAIPLPDPVVRRPEPAGMDVAALERSLRERVDGRTGQ